MSLPSRPNSFGNDVEKDTAGCRAFFRNHIAGGIKPIYDKDITAMPFASRFVTPLQKAVINYIGFSICKCAENS